MLPIRPKIPVSITVISSGISGKKEDNFARFTQIFENLLREISVPSDIWKFSGKVTEKSIRKLMNFRMPTIPTKIPKFLGGKLKGTEISDKNYIRKLVSEILEMLFLSGY